MTYEQDPTRWTTEGSDAPDVLRDLMQAGAQEGPSAAQLSALGAKAAAMSATGSTASVGALGGAKLWLAGAAVTAIVAGGVVIRTDSDPAPAASSERVSAEVEAANTPSIPSPAAAAAAQPRAVANADTPATDSAGTNAEPPTTLEVGIENTRSETATTGRPAVRRSSRTRAARRSTQATRRATTAEVAAEEPTRQALRPEAPGAKRNGSEGPSDVQLLQQARQALGVSPRRALELAKDHAKSYPSSQFAQERDALIIEALTRTGSLDRARRAANRFVRRYPNSAHAHRFRERLELD